MLLDSAVLWHVKLRFGDAHVCLDARYELLNPAEAHFWSACILHVKHLPLDKRLQLHSFSPWSAVICLVTKMHPTQSQLLNLAL